MACSFNPRSCLKKKLAMGCFRMSGQDWKASEDTCQDIIRDLLEAYRLKSHTGFDPMPDLLHAVTNVLLSLVIECFVQLF